MLKKTSYFPITLAFAANYPDSIHRNKWALENSSGLQYSPDPHCLEMLPRRIEPFLEWDIPIRFHTRYFEFELGHAEKEMADQALKKHMQTLAQIKDFAEPVVTVHTGLTSDYPVREERIIESLSRLTEFADKLGMVISLENLRRGHAGDPCKVHEWAEASGAMLTLDVGHALGCIAVQNNTITLPEIVELYAPRLCEAHIYGKEDDSGHHPITDIKPLGQYLKKLMQTDCSWWTIELSDPDEAISTRNIIESFFESCSVSG
ncbi:MAG: sugar phosphate isomerase/epimerase family protein [Desulfonatronovibrio sp.]|nr:TIM barrel protein [Desulfovibrionales bacterium]